MSPTCEKPRRVARLTAVASSAQTDAAGIVILGQAFGLIRRAREISRYSYRKMVQNVVLAFCFNGIGIPLAATKLVYPVWAMVAMAVSITAIFFNSLWGRPSLFINAILSDRPNADRTGAATVGRSFTIWPMNECST